MKTLHVVYQTQSVGTLMDVGHAKLAFQYDSTWLEGKLNFPISVQLPLKPEIFEDHQCHAFFANLLPEGNQRELVAKKQQISVQNDFKLLEAIGGDCAGALSIVSDQANLHKTGHYEPLSPGQLMNIIRELPKTPLLNGSSDVRLSLAGVQEKLPLYYESKQFYVPHGAYASNVIIKPALAKYPSSSINEWFCMQLAAKADVPVPETFLLPEYENLYGCYRFDRVIEKFQVVRCIHQEDFCSAYGKMPGEKYESEGGIGIAECVQLIKRISQSPVVDIRNLLKWVLFNYLIGNADAHSKNIALLQMNQETYRGWSLAPFYDLLSTSVYPELSEKLAMKIGGENRPDWLKMRHWKRLTETFEITWPAFVMLANTTIQGVLLASVWRFMSAYPVIQDIRKIVDERVKNLKDQISLANPTQP